MKKYFVIPAPKSNLTHASIVSDIYNGFDTVEEANKSAASMAIRYYPTIFAVCAMVEMVTITVNTIKKD